MIKISKKLRKHSKQREIFKILKLGNTSKVKMGTPSSKTLENQHNTECHR